MYIFRLQLRLPHKTQSIPYTHTVLTTPNSYDPGSHFLSIIYLPTYVCIHRKSILSPCLHPPSLSSVQNPSFPQLPTGKCRSSSLNAWPTLLISGNTSILIKLMRKSTNSLHQRNTILQATEPQSLTT